ncbi:MAG: hypothetical protein R2744_07845 [Bacteroidales bacterium]
MTANAQEEPAFGITWSGYVKTDIFYDSRQTVTAREGHFLLWPAAESLDENGLDINSRGGFNILSIQSRIKGAISGPDAFGAKTSGVIEADFFAQANDNINLLRLRLAYVTLNWTNLEVMAGQYWNPFFVTDCFPGTVSFNTGTPLHSFSRNPQVRAVYNTGNLRFTGAILSQRDFTSRGAAGITSDYLRNSMLPDMHLQVQFGPGSGGNFIAGAGVEYKSIVPRLESRFGPPINQVYKVNEKVNSFSALLYSKVTTTAFTFKVEGRYGENIADLLAISGFAVRDVIDPVTGEQDYTPLRSLSFWSELHTNGAVQVGIFGGYFRNLGTTKEMSDPGNTIYGLGTDINSLTRIAPRLIFNSGKTRVAFEMEITSASYGTNWDEYHIPANTIKVTNLRGLIGIYYFF